MFMQLFLFLEGLITSKQYKSALGPLQDFISSIELLDIDQKGQCQSAIHVDGNLVNSGLQFNYKLVSH